MTKFSYDVISFKEARRRLRVSQPVFNALVWSRLLGNYYPEGYILVAGVEHYERYGTQWITEERDDLQQRVLTVDMLENMPQPPDRGEGEQTSVQSRMYIFSDETPDLEKANATDTGWLAQFYLTPNTFYFPPPTMFGMLAGQFLKLDAPMKVEGTKLPACLYPDPYGSLGMVTVYGIKQPLEKAYEIAYDTVGPILDELASQHDQPLPIAHTLVVRIPSGLMTTNYAKAPRTKTLSKDEPVLPSCPYPQLVGTVALYREGISSNNPFHQFLTLWRTYENACEVRGRWRREHRRRDKKPHDEVIPEGTFAYREYRGLPFDEVKQQMERPFRVALAHGSDIRDREPITAASAEDLMAVSDVVPVMRYMAQVTLKNVRATLASTEPAS